MTPAITINILKKISLEPIRLKRFKPSKGDDEFVTVYPPQSSRPDDTIQIRILSSEQRQGMVS